MNIYKYTSLVVVAIVFHVSLNLLAQNYSMRQKNGSWLSAELGIPQCSEVVDKHGDQFYSQYNYHKYSGFVADIEAKIKIFEDSYLICGTYICKENDDEKYILTSNSMGKTYTSGYSSTHSDFYYGNIFVGMELGTSIPNLHLEFGGRIPALISYVKWSENIGAFHDLERIDASLTVTTLKCLATYSNYTDSDGIYYSFTAGPEIWFMDTGDTGSGVYLFNQAVLGYCLKSFNFSAGISGIITGVSESPFNNTKSIYQMNCKASFSLGNIVPEITYRLPFKVSRGISSVFSFGLAYKIE